MKRVRTNLLNPGMIRLLMLNFVVFFLSCEKEMIDPPLHESFDVPEEAELKAKHNRSTGPFMFSAPVYDIAGAPDGSILVAVNKPDTKEIQQLKNGEFRLMAELEAPSAIQGIAAIGAGNAFVTTAGGDLAQFGELYRVSNGNARMVADLAAYERDNDPDAFAGLQWKDQLCEAIDGFSAGPQNNPFNVVGLSGGTALVADAAGNTLLSAKTNGEIDWKAIFTPPTDENGDWIVRWDAGDESGSIPCYVQPVPTSVALGPDGYVYVGELTGAVAEGTGLPIELSRVWRIPADANNVVCEEGSGVCEVFLDGLTSVIDLAIGPDGLLYVVELDEMSWISSFVPGLAAGGTISAYELDGDGTPVKQITGLSFPSAITFDKAGNLWLLENNNIALPGYDPTLRMLEF